MAILTFPGGDFVPPDVSGFTWLAWLWSGFVLMYILCSVFGGCARYAKSQRQERTTPFIRPVGLIVDFMLTYPVIAIFFFLAWQVAFGVVGLLAVDWEIPVDWEVNNYMEVESDIQLMETIVKNAVAKQAESLEEKHGRDRRLQKVIEPQTLDYWVLDVYYTAREDDGNVFTPEAMKVIQEFEQDIVNFRGYQNFCRKGRHTKECLTPESVVSIFNPTLSKASDASVEIAYDGRGQCLSTSFVARTAAMLDQIGVHWWWDREFEASRVFGRATRSRFTGGVPLKQGIPVSPIMTIEETAEEEALSREFLYSLYNEVLQTANDGNSVVTISWRENFFLNAYEVLHVLQGDILWALGSFLLVFVMLLLKLRNFALTVCGLTGVFTSFATVFYWYRVVGGFETMNLINFLSLYFILGIAVDDILILMDVYSVELERYRPKEAMKKAVAKAGSAMLATSATTSVAFFSLCTSSIKVLRAFGFFMGVIIAWNFINVVTILPPAILLSELRRARNIVAAAPTNNEDDIGTECNDNNVIGTDNSLRAVAWSESPPSPPASESSPNCPLPEVMSPPASPSSQPPLALVDPVPQLDLAPHDPPHPTARPPRCSMFAQWLWRFRLPLVCGIPCVCLIMGCLAAVSISQSISNEIHLYSNNTNIGRQKWILDDLFDSYDSITLRSAMRDFPAKATINQMCPGISDDGCSICSGRGKCVWDVADYSHSTCSCDPGWFGETCAIDAAEAHTVGADTLIFSHVVVLSDALSDRMGAQKLVVFNLGAVPASWQLSELSLDWVNISDFSGEFAQEARRPEASTTVSFDLRGKEPGWRGDAIVNLTGSMSLNVIPIRLQAAVVQKVAISGMYVESQDTKYNVSGFHPEVDTYDLQLEAESALVRVAAVFDPAVTVDSVVISSNLTHGDNLVPLASGELSSPIELPVDHSVSIFVQAKVLDVYKTYVLNLVRHQPTQTTTATAITTTAITTTATTTTATAFTVTAITATAITATATHTTVTTLETTVIVTTTATTTTMISFTTGTATATTTSATTTSMILPTPTVIVTESGVGELTMSVTIPTSASGVESFVCKARLPGVVQDHIVEVLNTGNGNAANLTFSGLDVGVGYQISCSTKDLTKESVPSLSTAAKAIAKPFPPTVESVTVTAAGEFSVKLSFHNEATAPVRGVRCRALTTNGTIEQETDHSRTHDRRVSVAGLTFGVAYTFQCAAINGAGISIFGQTFHPAVTLVTFPLPPQIACLAPGAGKVEITINDPSADDPTRSPIAVMHCYRTALPHILFQAFPLNGWKATIEYIPNGEIVQVQCSGYSEVFPGYVVESNISEAFTCGHPMTVAYELQGNSLLAGLTRSELRNYLSVRIGVLVESLWVYSASTDGSTEFADFPACIVGVPTEESGGRRLLGYARVKVQVKLFVLDINDYVPKSLIALTDDLQSWATAKTGGLTAVTVVEDPVALRPEQTDCTLHKLDIVSSAGGVREVRNMEPPFDSSYKGPYYVNVTSAEFQMDLVHSADVDSVKVNGNDVRQTYKIHDVYPAWQDYEITVQAFDQLSVSSYLVSVSHSAGTCGMMCVNGFCDSGTCRCNEDYYLRGPSLCTAYCPGLGSRCSGRGTCCDQAVLAQSEEERLSIGCLARLWGSEDGCACDDMSYGAGCEYLKCPGKHSLGDCSGRGACNSTDGTCTCRDGWAGSDCSETVDAVPMHAAVEVQLVSGITGYDGFKRAEYDPRFSLTPATQQWLLNVCAAARADESLHVRMETACWIEKFAADAGADGGFPVKTSVDEALSSWFRKQTNHDYSHDIGTFGPGYSGRLRYARVRMHINIRKSAKPADLEAIYMKWVGFVDTQNIAAPVGAKILMVSSGWSQMDVQRIAQRSTITSIIVSLSLTAVLVTLFIGDPILASFFMITIFLSIMSLLFFLTRAFRMGFGPIQVIGITTFMGLNVDHVFHICHGYQTSRYSARKDKVRDALARFGPAVVGGALSTAGAASFLLACNILPLYELGVMLVLNMAITIFLTFFVLSPMLMMAGSNVQCWSRLRAKYFSNGIEFHFFDVVDFIIKSVRVDDDDDGSGNGDDKFAVVALSFGSAEEAARSRETALGISISDRIEGERQGVDTIRREIMATKSQADIENLNYILDGIAGKKEYFPEQVKKDCEQGSYHGGNFDAGDYDTGHEGMRFIDFVQLENCQKAGVSAAEVCAIRLYTTSTYKLYNRYLRERVMPHPLAMTVYFLASGLAKLRAVAAGDRDEFVKEVTLWRGLQNSVMKNIEDFKMRGGTELAAMSTTTSRDVALKYSSSSQPLLFKYTCAGMSKGVNISFLSVYPLEQEFLYPPGTFLRFRGDDVQKTESSGRRLGSKGRSSNIVNEIHVEPQFPT